MGSAGAPGQDNGAMSDDCDRLLEEMALPEKSDPFAGQKDASASEGIVCGAVVMDARIATHMWAQAALSGWRSTAVEAAASSAVVDGYWLQRREMVVIQAETPCLAAGEEDERHPRELLVGDVELKCMGRDVVFSLATVMPHASAKTKVSQVKQVLLNELFGTEAGDRPCGVDKRLMLVIAGSVLQDDALFLDSVSVAGKGGGGEGRFPHTVHVVVIDPSPHQAAIVKSNVAAETEAAEKEATAVETAAAADTAARARAEAIQEAVAPKTTVNAKTEAEQAPSDRMVELGLGQAACAASVSGSSPANVQATAATVEAAAGEPVAFLLEREAKVVEAAEIGKKDTFADAVQVVPLPAPFSQGSSGGEHRDRKAADGAEAMEGVVVGSGRDVIRVELDFWATLEDDENADEEVFEILAATDATMQELVTAANARLVQQPVGPTLVHGRCVRELEFGGRVLAQTDSLAQLMRVVSCATRDAWIAHVRPLVLRPRLSPVIDVPPVSLVRSIREAGGERGAGTRSEQGGESAGATTAAEGAHENAGRNEREEQQHSPRDPSRAEVAAAAIAANGVEVREEPSAPAVTSASVAVISPAQRAVTGVAASAPVKSISGAAASKKRLVAVVLKDVLGGRADLEMSVPPNLSVAELKGKLCMAYRDSPAPV